MWSSFSLQDAQFWYDLANWFLIGALVIGVIATFVVVRMGNVKEEHLRRDLASTAVHAAIADERAATANERAAVLEKEAAQTRLEAEKMRELAAWRRLSNPQMVALASALRGKISDKNIWVLSGQSDPETTTYADDIMQAFKDAGVKNVWHMTPEALGRSTGLHITHGDTPDGIVIKSAFQSIGLTLLDTQQGFIGPRVSEQSAIHIWIAAKPPAFFTANGRTEAARFGDEPVSNASSK